MSGTAQPIVRDLPNEVHFREFQTDPVTGHYYHGTCGETALATAMVCSTPKIESTQDAINLMTSLARDMIAKGWADKPEGSTTTAHLRDEAHAKGFTTKDGNFTGNGKTHPLFIGYSEPLDMDWLHAVLLEYAGVVPIILEVARAGQLNSYNGGNDEAGVQYHFICIVGINKDGYVCNDGDNSAISSHLVVYPWSEIQQARPCGILVLDMQEASPMGLPQGWKDDGKQLTNPVNKFTVQTAKRQFILDNEWDAADVPIQDVEDRVDVEEANPDLGAGNAQTFRMSRLIWDNKQGKVTKQWIGQEYLFVRNDRDAKAAALAAALKKIDALQAQLDGVPVPSDPAPANDALGDAVRALFAEMKKEGVL